MIQLQIYLKFANFYKYFVRFYARVIRALRNLFENKKNKK